MLRSVVFAVGLAGVLAATHPVLADPSAAAKPDQVQVVAQPAAPVASVPPSPDATPPENTGVGKNIVTVGFGWG